MLPARFIERLGISIWHSVPSTVPLMLKEPERALHQLQSLRVVSFCGEPLFPQQAAALLAKAPSVKLLNTYGPTEGTFFCSAQVVTSDVCTQTHSGSLAIGNPIPGWRFAYEPIEELSLEELIIESNFLSEGYITDSKDAERFGVNQTGTRTYRTGDLVRRDAGGTYFVQRSDNQVKVRGNRIDLTEIEFLALESGVVEAKAFLHDGAIFLAVDLGNVALSILRAFLENNLPRYAIPADILEAAPLPRNQNAKIDAAALRRLVGTKWGT